MSQLTKQDRAIYDAYTTILGATEPMVARRLGVSRHVVRAALQRCLRAGMEVKRAIKSNPPKTMPRLREDVVVATVAQMSCARISDDSRQTQVSLQRVSILLTKDEPAPPLRLRTPVPEVTPIDEMKARRLALLKSVHQTGLRRGLFQSRSR